MIDINIKSNFFDRPKVQAAVDKARRRALSRAGAYIRTSARTSIRKRKSYSAPGRPPHSHEGSLRKLILFGYDRRTDSVVVGPVGFRRSVVPNLLEFGGKVRNKRRRVVRANASSVGATGRIAAGNRRVIEAGEELNYEPRPYMRPALDREKDRIPKAWKNSIRGG